MSDYFPADVTNEILKRLPAASLIRFTAVCKSWRRLITQPSFVSAHLLIARTRSPTHLLRRCLVDDDTERYSLLEPSPNGGIVASHQIHFPFKSKPRDDYPFTHTYFRILGSYNGLLCLVDVLSRTAVDRIIFWNPAVRHSVVLPNPGINLQSDYVFVLGFGGGADDDGDTKLVRLVYSLKAEDSALIFYPQAEIFSLKEGSWRRLERLPTHLQIMDYTWHQALLNQVVHWIAYKLVGDDDPTSCTSILTFNFNTEDFGEVLLPPELCEKSPSTLYPARVVGSLGVISFDAATGLDVWMMKEYTWTKLYRISMLDRGITRIVALWSQTKALVAVKGKELGCYDSESEQVTKLGISGTKRTFYVDDFVESLMLVKREGVVEDEDDYPCGA